MSVNSSRTRSTSSSSLSWGLFWAAALAVAIVLCFGVILAYAHHRTTVTSKNTAAVQQAAKTATAGSTTSASSSGSAQTNDGQSAKQQAAPTNEADISAPSGNLVSNHNPSLNSAQEESVCNTTPGASCSISFTKDDGTTVSLPQQTTDANGGTLWNWSLSTYNIGVGTWKITATATSGSITKTATDAIPLRVSQ